MCQQVTYIARGVPADLIMLLSRQVIPRGEVAASMLAWFEHKTGEVKEKEGEVKDKQAEKLQLEIQVARMESLLQSFSTRYMHSKGLFHARGLIGATCLPQSCLSMVTGVP